MKGINTWSYRPYRPFLVNVGDIYVCRVVPYTDKIHFEWLEIGDVEYEIYYRERLEGEYILAGKTKNTEFDIENLEEGLTYQFYVCAGDKKSRIRLAKCGKSVGITVNYLHPEDMAYAFSGRYLCSPSLVRHPDGYLLTSMDLFAGNSPQNLTLIFRSDDEGKTWHYVSELMPCFWGKLFIHKNELYMLSCSTEYGDLLIGKSLDGGKTFCTPTVLLRGSNGKLGNTGVHKNPQNIMYYGGRIWETLEWGSWGNKEYCHAAMVMSCDENADLLVAENWNFSYPQPFDYFEESLNDVKKAPMMIEGTLVVNREGKLQNVMRFEKYHKAIVFNVNCEDLDAPLEYSHCMDFPANYSKFMIKYDEKSDAYYSIASEMYNPEKKQARNLLSFLKSKDLKTWEIVYRIFDYKKCSHKDVGFQYIDFYFEGEDIIFLSRTAINGAAGFHDSNYQTFHKLNDFRTNTKLEF